MCLVMPILSNARKQDRYGGAVKAGARAGSGNAAATQMLARCEGTEPIVEQQYRYILQEYADTRREHQSRR
jgi:hypothetical protein